MTLEVVLVALPWFGSHVDCYVVCVYGDTSFVDKVTEYHIYHGLEGGRGVGQTEEHDRWFI